MALMAWVDGGGFDGLGGLGVGLSPLALQRTSAAAPPSGSSSARSAGTRQSSGGSGDMAHRTSMAGSPSGAAFAASFINMPQLPRRHDSCGGGRGLVHIQESVQPAAAPVGGRLSSLPCVSSSGDTGAGNDHAAVDDAGDAPQPPAASASDSMRSARFSM